jgi:decaprenylphospho-beta-D-erythro-pentofuranosid-2-ulose 2-reductase
MNDAFGRPQSLVLLGGTSEIGMCIASKLVAATCRTVVLAGRDAASLDLSAKRLRDDGADSVHTVLFDASDLGSVNAVVEACFDAADGRVDMVVVAVGALGEEGSDHLDPERIETSFTVNATWPASALSAVTDRLGRQGSGRVVVLSSVAAVRARPPQVVYGAAKAGLDTFAVGLADLVRGSGVKVHVVRPGFVFSKMTRGRRPAPFAVQPDDVADAVVRGLVQSRTVIWVPGLLRWLYVVLRHLPDRLWGRMAK